MVVCNVLLQGVIIHVKKCIIQEGSVMLNVAVVVIVVVAVVVVVVVVVVEEVEIVVVDHQPT